MTDNANGTATCLYLVRHGEATSKDENPDRPLTDRGIREVEKMAAWAEAVGLSVGRIRHSGKLRARQTAEAFDRRLSPNAETVAIEGLGPTDDVAPVAESLGSEEGPVMLVGHLPFLDRLLGRLLTGDPEAKLVEFEAAGLAALCRSEGSWTLTGLLGPAWVP